jgi:hypothetical protein
MAVGASGDGASSTELLVDPRRTMTKRYLAAGLGWQLASVWWAGLMGCGLVSSLPYFFLLFLLFLFIFYF